jgi:hypothetical protein
MPVERCAARLSGLAFGLAIAVGPQGRQVSDEQTLRALKRLGDQLTS